MPRSARAPTTGSALPPEQRTDRLGLDCPQTREQLPVGRWDIQRRRHRAFAVARGRRPLRVAGEVSGVAVDRAAVRPIAEDPESGRVSARARGARRARDEPELLALLGGAEERAAQVVADEFVE